MNLKNGDVSYTFSYENTKYSFETGDGRYTFDTVASFSCNEGYYLSGTEETTCQTSGKWNMDHPECNLGKEMNIVIRNEHSILISLNSTFPWFIQLLTNEIPKIGLAMTIENICCYCNFYTSNPSN